MTPPGFWRYGTRSPLPALLSPLSMLAARITQARVSRPGWAAAVPVLCCGNATVGGAGKTTLALDLGARLIARGLTMHFLTRGHGGAARGCLRVDPEVHDAAMVGDEALLLAAIAPCWVGADRAVSARAALADGAHILVMDDGLQNPSLVQTCPILVIDGASGFGNGRVLPAGPLREPVAAAAARASAAVLIGPDATGALALLPPSLPVLRAWLVPGAIAGLPSRRVLAFAGIARPEKFFASVGQAGLELAGKQEFADHHAYSAREMRTLGARAAGLGAILLTTPKDHVRIAAEHRGTVHVLGVSLGWEDEAALDRMLDQALT
jgi:tetraacyldisaccharide 4'-kinase